MLLAEELGKVDGSGADTLREWPGTFAFFKKAVIYSLKVL